MKKLLVFIGLLAVAGGIGFAIYYLFFLAPAPVAPPPEEVNANVAPPGALPEAPVGPPTVIVPRRPEELPPGVSLVAEGGVTAVTPIAPVPTAGAALTPGGALNYYSRVDGKFYRVNPDGTVGSLSNKVFFNVKNAKFDAGGDKAILEYPDGSNILFDFRTNRQVTLPQHWEAFDFSPAGDRIAAKSIGLDEANRFLVVSNPDGSGARAVQELGANADKVQVAWSPNNQIIATASTGQSFGADRHEVFFVGQNQENFRSMVVEGLDFRPRWAPAGRQLLYSVAGSVSDYKPLLWVVDAQGDDIGRNRRSLNVNTWADKCTFADDSTLYCAVPDELPRGAGLQPAIADETPDTLYRIDVTTGLQTKIAIPEGAHTIANVMLSPAGAQLYFTDKISGTINRIQLEQ